MDPILAPIPGILYLKPNPEAEPYVRPGQRVNPGETVALVEVMKSFFEVKSPVAGVIKTVLLENEAPVHAGQPLFELGE